MSYSLSYSFKTQSRCANDRALERETYSGLDRNVSTHNSCWSNRLGEPVEQRETPEHFPTALTLVCSFRGPR